MRKKIVLVIFSAFLCVQPAYSYWIWTPKTNKWVNPKTEAKADPKEQLDFAKSLLEARELEDAKREFQKILKTYPKAVEAAEAQYWLGVIEQERGNLYEAFLEYQKVVEKYPFSERIAEIIERAYNIGEAYMTGKAKRKAFGVKLPVENPAIEIFTRVVQFSQYGPYAAKAQYKLGLVYKSLAQYFEAEEAFNKVVTNYPDSEWAAAAKFQIADSRAKVSKSAAYDQGATKEAKEKFEEFVLTNPDAELSSEAEKQIRGLKERQAESNYTIALFYEKQKNYSSAEIYYNDVIDNNPDSPWAARAIERLKIMERRRR
jgi:outer membrane assembly lipoprotein YfiO